MSAQKIVGLQQGPRRESLPKKAEGFPIWANLSDLTNKKPRSSERGLCSS